MAAAIKTNASSKTDQWAIRSFGVGFFIRAMVLNYTLDWLNFANRAWAL
jgi:hypothetical protein